jgi:hypothetical protein
MDPRTLLLVVGALLACATAPHLLAALLLFAVMVVIAVVHLFLVLASVAIVGTVLSLTALIAVRVRATGPGCRPAGRPS